MKKLTKIMLLSGILLMLGAGAVFSYLRAQCPMSPQEDLTLANIEALGKVHDENPGEMTQCIDGPGVCVIFVCPGCPVIWGHNVQLNGGLEFIYPPQV